MKTKIVVPLLFLLLLPARYLRAQSLDGAVDARADASLTVDAARSDAATGGAGGAAGGAAGATGAKDAGAGGATGAKDAGAAHDAAPPPPIKFFFNEAPGCSIGGSAGPGSHGGLPIATALVAAAILRRRRRDGGSARV
jgi:MYXO-CTERM domain-containing protein